MAKIILVGRLECLGPARDRVEEVLRADPPRGVLVHWSGPGSPILYTITGQLALEDQKVAIVELKVWLDGVRRELGRSLASVRLDVEVNGKTATSFRLDPTLGIVADRPRPLRGS